MTRRRFAFWLGICLFWVAQKLHANAIDELAAAILPSTEPSTEPNTGLNTGPSTGPNTGPNGGSAPKARSDPMPDHERWTAVENNDWRWFQRETMVDGQWKRSGITTPINKSTGEAHTGEQGYLDGDLVPRELRYVHLLMDSDSAKFADDGPDKGQPTAERRSHDGRPPSKWLRRLNADELRVWLKTVHVPYVGVGGMTFWTHLTRDHSFDTQRIDGLTLPEQAKLHSAAHFGY